MHNLDPSSSDRLGGLCKLSRLESFCSPCQDPHDRCLSAHISPLPLLRRLDLSYSPNITHIGIRTLVGLRLMHLDLSFCPSMDDRLLRLLAQREKAVESAQGEAALPLQTLVLSGCWGVTDAGVEALAALQHLRTLRLADCPQLSLSRASSLPVSLHELDLSLRRPGPDPRQVGLHAGFWSNLPRLHRLTKLKLDYCSVADKNLPQISLLRASLVSLHLRGCAALSADGVAVLSSLSLLTHLDLRTCDQLHVGDDCVDDLWKALRRCFILVG